MTVDVRTFGCRLNLYESEVIREQAQAANVHNAIIFNTCAVTKEAERQARQAIRRARRENPDARIIVTGCAAQVNPGRYARMSEVDQVIGNEEKMSAAAYQFDHADTPKVQVNDILSVRETASHLVASFDGHTRAFVQVQNGCNHRCTFCIIPYGRGNSRSVPVAEVVRQVRHLVEQGTREVVLTGVDVSSYGEDLPGTPTLGQLCKRLLSHVPELPRLRLSSIDAAEIDADLLALFGSESRLMPHLHLSLQAGDDLILKRMKRRHSRDDAIRLCERVRQVRPDIVFGADFITGFPTESKAMFAQTLRLVEEADITYLHVFPYSEREGTPAERMPQVDVALRKERASRLRALGTMQEKRFYQRRIGTHAEVLVEKDGTGRSEHFVPVRCRAEDAGRVMHMRLEGLAADCMTGSVQ